MKIMRFLQMLKPALFLSIPLGLGYLIFAPVFQHAKTSAERSSCQSNLKQIALTCAQYWQDNNGRFPAISRGGQGWADVLKTQSGSRSYSIFHCPTVGKRDSRSSDYFLSARVANLQTSQLKFAEQAISFGEGLPKGGTNSHFSEMPFDWKSDNDTPARRHAIGANYAFADGHVKWLRPEKITTQAPKNGAYTFAVR